MKKLTPFFLLLTFFTLSLSGKSSFAQNADVAKDVELFASTVGDKIVSIANEKKLSELSKRTKIIAEIDRVVDAEWISRFVLGKNYRNITELQKSKFSELYRQFMINTYGPKFRNYNGRKFTVNSVEQQNSFYVAKCEFMPINSNTSIKVDLRIKNREGKMLVLDFVAEGVSLIETQRSEFNEAISSKGMDGFIADFGEKVEELKRKNKINN